MTEAAKSKRPTPVDEQATQQPMRSGIRPAQRRAPSADEKKERRQMALHPKRAGAEDMTETSDRPMTEHELLAAMASAPTLAAQSALWERVQEIRRTKSAALRSGSEIDFQAPPTGGLGVLPTHEVSRHTAASDWMLAIPTGETDPREVDNAMRAEASLWFMSLLDEVKADPAELTIQAEGMARRRGGSYGEQREQAEGSFLAQVGHLAAVSGLTMSADVSTHQDPPYGPTETSSLPVGVDNEAKADPADLGDNTGEPQTSTDMSPSLGEGNSPEGDQAQTVENPAASTEHAEDGKDTGSTDYISGDTTPNTHGEGRKTDASRREALKCVCAHNNDGSVTTMLCPLHADNDPCATMSAVTGGRRSGSIVNGTCTNCGWSTKAKTSAKTAEGHPADDYTYRSCPNHPGKSYNMSTGDCSCGSNHNRWASSTNPGGQKSSTTHQAEGLGGGPDDPRSTEWDSPSLAEGDSPDGDQAASGAPLAQDRDNDAAKDDKSTDTKDTLDGTVYHATSSLAQIAASAAEQTPFTQALGRLSSVDESFSGVPGRLIASKALRSLSAAAQRELRAHLDGRVAAEYGGGSPKEGDTAKCHKDGGAIQFFAGEWQHLKGTGDGHNDVHPATPKEQADKDAQSKSSAVTATRYCPTHKVYVGAGNQEQHDHCPVETRKKKSALGWEQVTSGRTAADDGGKTCATCGDPIERDPKGEDNRSWHHSNGEVHDHEAKPKEQAEADHVEYERTRNASRVGWEAVTAGGAAPFGGRTAATADARPLYEIADEIRRDWKPVNYAAKPYLEAMQQMNSIADRFYEDDGLSVVSYFLNNASTWRGETAKRVKAELRSMVQQQMKNRYSSRRRTAVHLDNVGIAGPGMGSGTAPDGTLVHFRLSPEDEAKLKAVLYSDLAVNFSGVDVGPEDIVSEQGGGNSMTGPSRAGAKAADRHSDDTGAFRVDVAGVGEGTWSANSITWDTAQEAEDAARDLLSRWYGADMARVVPSETPRREPVDPSDPLIVINYR